MAVAFLHLDCVRGASVEEVSVAVRARLTGEGFVAVKSGGERAVKVINYGDWIIVEDRPDHFAEEWGAALSKGAGRVGISMRSWSESGEMVIARFDEGRETGSLSFDAPLHEGAKIKVGLGLLADLAPARMRDKLRVGLDVTKLSCDEALMKIAKAIGLPPPTAHKQDVEASLTLEFSVNPKRPKPSDKPVVRPIGTTVLNITDSFHLEDITRGELVKAVRDVLARKGIEPRKEGSRRAMDCEIVVVQRGEWVSFGEILHGDRADENKRVRWGKLLSPLLHARVLAVETWTTGTSMRPWVNGKEGRHLRLPEHIVGGGVDASFLGGPSAIEIGTGAAAQHLVAARKVAEAMGLSDPFLVGKGLEGIVVAFDSRRPSAV